MKIVFRSFILATKLDIFDLYYLAGNKSFNFIEKNPAILPRKGFLVRIGAYVIHFFQQIKKTLMVKNLPNGKILFFVSTKNQRDAVLNLSNSIKDAVLVGEKCDLEFYFPLFWAYLAALPYLPFLLFKYLKAEEYHRKTFRYFVDIYLLTYGYYVVSRFWLLKMKPLCIVMANDHNMQNRVINTVCDELNIPTIYLQHASVTEQFPPLNFDFALLEGLDALKKYTGKGFSKTTIYLIGMPKADAFSQVVNCNTTVDRLGVCCNMLDEVFAIEDLCREIATQFPNLTLILRPHPGDIRRQPVWKKMSDNLGMIYSDSQAESAFSFLGRVDAVIAGESNIHLEAALMEVYPLYYDFTGKALDWYGFMKNGVVEYYDNLPELCMKISALIQEKPLVRHRCKVYCHTVGTKFDWQSSLLARELIENIAAGQSLNEKIWQPLSETEDHVFQPG